MPKDRRDIERYQQLDEAIEPFSGRRYRAWSRWRRKLALVLEDLLSSRSHSRDFTDARSEYLRQRLTMVAWLLATLVLLWIPLDYWLLPEQTFWRFAGARVTLALCMALIAWRTGSGRSLFHEQAMLYALLLVLNLGYFAAQLSVTGTSSSGLLFGYSLFPFIYIALLSLFPHTLFEGFRAALITLAVLLVKHWHFGTLFSFQALSDMWFLGLLTLVSMWAQLGQLNMLLRLFRQATRDQLTGLYNRRMVMKNMQLAVDRCQVLGVPVTVLILDLNKFKRINDQYGHIAGDRVLQAFARTLVDSLRDTDIAGRYGGEEFVVLLPGIEVEQALVTAERIRQCCEQLNVYTSDYREIRFTTSIGVACIKAGESIEQLIERADESLYRAKHQGRNRVTVTRD